jgi:predicted dehydrogenase
MGNQGNSSEGHRLLCEWVWDGAIGPVREVHAWSTTGGWASAYTERPKDAPPVPAGLDWELWIGPAPARPYHPAYAPFNWRGWWDFGTGAVGDMGCHNIDPAFRALKLGSPATVEASSTRINGETVPEAAIIHYTFPSRGEMPPVKLTWYDCGLMPPVPEELPPGTKLDGNGVLLVGDKGKILSGGWSRDPRLLPESRMKEYKQPPKTMPRVASHDRAWIDAAKGGAPASSNFDYSGPLTELVLLGVVALRTGEKIHWDGPAMRVTNAPKAEQYVKAKFRAGWTL